MKMGELGRLIKSARVQQDVSLRQMADELGVSAMYLSEIENSKKIPTKGDVLALIADYFDFKQEELLELAFKEKKEATIKNQPNAPYLAVARRLRSASPETLKLLLNILKSKGEPG